tara:strand:- start:330 stop:920 length:591 start_codon:yes stop_codon:yes gene_type:complete
MKTSEHRRAIVAKSREKNQNKYDHEAKKKADREYYAANKKAVRAKQAVYQEKNRKKLNKQSQAINKARLKTDPIFKLQCLMRTRIGNHLRGRCKKGGVTFKLIGCSPKELHAHLQGKGAIDHIFPLARYDAASEQHKMTNWKNLQRLTRMENSDKRDQLPTKAMASKVPRHLWPNGVTEDMLPDIYDGWKTSLKMN